MSKIKSILSVIFYAIYMAECIQQTHLKMIVGIMYFILLSSSNRKYDPIVKGYVMKQCMYFYVFMFSLRIYVSEHPLDFLYKRELCYYVGYCDNPHSNIKALCTETVHLASVAILK